MDSYEVFKQFLDDNDVHYAEDKLEHGDRFFRIPQRIKSGNVVDTLVVFTEKSIKVLVFGITTIEDENKQLECCKLFNELNSRYSFFKFYLRPNGDVNLEGDAILGIVEGEFQARALMGFIVAAVTLVQENFGEIMKLQWS